MISMVLGLINNEVYIIILHNKNYWIKLSIKINITFGKNIWMFLIHTKLIKLEIIIISLTIFYAIIYIHVIYITISFPSKIPSSNNYL